jgi:lambda repressor-like predicted transcriptional regulator
VIKRVTGAAQILTRAEMIAELRMRMGGRSMSKCGAEWGVSRQEIHAVLNEDQFPGENILAALGLREESEIMYVRGPAVNGKRKMEKRR